jgi:tape measure domain-containing protein
MGLDSSQYNKGLAMAQKSAGGAGNFIRNALSFTVGMGAFQALQRGFQGTIGTAIEFNTLIENANLGFTTMLGSAEKAQAFLNQMGDFAAKTPFEYPELLQASQHMMALGFAADEVLPSLKAIGDATAALGQGSEAIDRIVYALGQMRMTGRLNAQDMMQLTNAGINAWQYLADASGKSIAEIRKLSEQGAISGVQAAEIIIAGMEKQFPDMMSKMENTWQGVTSTIKDVWRMTIGAITQSTFSGITKWLGGIRDWATEFYNTFTMVSKQAGTAAGLQAAIVQGFGVQIGGTIIAIGDVISKVVNIAVTGAKWIIGHWSTIIPVLMGVLTAYLSLRTAMTITHSLARTTAILRGEIAATSVFGQFFARVVQSYKLSIEAASAAGVVHIGVLRGIEYGIKAVYAALGPLGAALLVIGSILTWLMTSFGKYKADLQQQALQKQLSGINTQMKNIQSSTMPAVAGVGDFAKGLDKVGKSSKKAQKVLSNNLQSFDEIHQLTTEAAGGIGDLAGGLGDIGGIGAGMPEIAGGFTMPEVAIPEMDFSMPEASFKQFLSDMWNDIVTWQGWDTLKKSWDLVASHAKDTWEATTGVVLNALSNMKAMSDRIGADLVKTTQKNWGEVTSFFERTQARLSELSRSIGSDVKTFVIQTWNDAVTTAHSVGEDIGGFFERTGSRMQITGHDIWGELEEYWNSVSTNMQTTGHSVWGDLGTYFGTTWTNTKNTASDIWGTTKDIITGDIDLRTGTREIWGDISTYFSTTWTDTKDTASRLWGDVSTFFSDTWGDTKELGHDVWDDLSSFFGDTWGDLKETTHSIWGEISTFTGDTWRNLQTTSSDIFGKIKNTVSDTWNDASSTTSRIWGNTKDFLSRTWSDISSTASRTWEETKNTINDKMSWLTGPLSDTWGSIKKTATDTWESLKKSAGSIFEDIKDAIIKPFKNIHIPLPHFSFTTRYTSIAGLSIPYPDVDVRWYDKGGIFTSPSIIGVGEKRPEFVGALDDLRKIIREEMQNIGSVEPMQNEQPIVINVNTEYGAIGQVVIKSLQDYARQHNGLNLPI